MIEEEYEKLKFQKELIENFTEEFNRRLGYKPVVITKTIQKTNGPLELMNLTDLKDCFEPFLPTLYGKKVPLDAKCRIREIIELRQMYFYLARSMGYKLVFIGYSLGKKDHTTVVHAINTFHNLLEVDEGYKNRFLTILNYIKSLKNESSVVADSDKVQDNS